MVFLENNLTVHWYFCLLPTSSVRTVEMTSSYFLYKNLQTRCNRLEDMRERA